METLRSLRRQNKKTVAEIANVLKVSEQAIRHYENGRRRISLESVLTLSKLYDFSAEDIIKAQLNSCQKLQ